MTSTTKYLFNEIQHCNFPKEYYDQFFNLHHHQATEPANLQFQGSADAHGNLTVVVTFHEENFKSFVEQNSKPQTRSQTNKCSTLNLPHESKLNIYTQLSTSTQLREEGDNQGSSVTQPSLSISTIERDSNQPSAPFVIATEGEDNFQYFTSTSSTEVEENISFVALDNQQIQSIESPAISQPSNSEIEKTVTMTTQEKREDLQAELEALRWDVDEVTRLITDHVTQPIVEVVADENIRLLTDMHTTANELKKTTFKLYSGEDRVQPLKLVVDITTEIYENKIKLMEIKNEIHVDPQYRPKLPAVKIPDFDGDELNWESFENMFTVVIHNDTRATPVEKLQHLISKMKGPAAHFVSSYEVTAVNYPIVLQLLKDRYGHTRRRIYAHLDKLFNIPAATAQSAVGLQSIVDTVKEALRGLQNLGAPTNHWDWWVHYLVLQKIDVTTRRYYEESLPDDQHPTLENLLKYVTNRIQALLIAPPKKRNEESTNSSNSAQNSTSKNTPANQKSNTTKATEDKGAKGQTKRVFKCTMCDEPHGLFACPKFKAMTQPQRYAFVKDKKLCTNCFGKHVIMECKSDRSCRTCEKRHNTLLHINTAPTNGQQQQSNHAAATENPVVAAPVQPAPTTHFINSPQPHSTVLLATALVQLVNQDGQEFQVRALIDPGSQCSLISEGCTNRVQLKRTNDATIINGASGQQVAVSKGITKFNLISKIQKDWNIAVSAIIIPKVSTELPQQNISSANWNHILGLQLADPYFNSPGQIDLLLGADVYNDILLDTRITGAPGQPVAHQTTLGYLLLGKVEQEQRIVTSNVVTSSTMEFDLSRFWEQEEQLPIHRLTNEEAACQTHFKTTHQRDSEGRYHVRLPFKSDPTTLGHSREIAIRRWNQVEKRLTREPARHQEYNDFMQEYLSLGHMRPVTKSKQNSTTKAYYMPHHFILKESSTTKLRVVFDASSASSNGKSLNEILMVGPTVQPDLWSITLRWRLYEIAFTADIEKLYRQIGVLPPDENFQRIVWRPNTTEELQDYELITVTYGTASAPFQATATLNRLADDEKKQFPIAAKIIPKDFYMDDLMGGGHTLQEARQIQNEVIKTMERGQFNLRKWSSNHPEILHSVNPESRETSLPLQIGKTENVKTLGLWWSPTQDEFNFILKFDANPKMSMRSLLSNIARIYDPMGYLAPTVIKLKLYMRTLFVHQLTWDQIIPTALQSEWKLLQHSMKGIEHIRIPRFINYTPTGVFQLHGFCDASEQAIAACVYFRGEVDGNINCHLIASKTRVAPTKNTSLPRLELTGSVLLSNLMKSVVTALQINIQHTYYWTDSTIVLHWISQPSSKWKTYVANRVAEVQELTLPHQWFHVKSEENAADCASRGLLAIELQQHHLWWHGPPWLMSHNFPTGPIPGSQFPPELLEERKNLQATTTTTKTDELLQQLSKFSSWWTTQKVAAYVLRFIHNLRSPRDLRWTHHLSLKELRDSEERILWLVQQQHFKKEAKSLIKKEPISKKSPLWTLNAFLDQHGLIRVGGRLSRAQISENQKHPMVLPRKNHMVNLVIDYYHKLYLHGGVQLISAFLIGKFYILHAKRTIRYVIHRCLKCIKFKAETATQMMADLPASRTTPARSFDVCGVDLAGPYVLRNTTGRNKTTYKGYIILFTCFTTRAIHLEVGSSQSTTTFMMALNRFISRRGLCSHMYCDNGGNFKGTANELKEQQEFLTSIQIDNTIAQELAKKSIQWHFNPARSPHFGAVWEIGVKLVKHHIRRTICNAPLTFEEFETLLVQVEAMVNSRPLSALTSNPDDLEPLTPGHFLIGTALNALPEPDLGEIRMNRLSRYQLLQRKQQDFWRKWSTEYLSRLQKRLKWMTPQPNFSAGDLVILMEDNMPPRLWKLAHILETHPGADGQVRVVTLRTNGGYDAAGRTTFSEYQRPVVKLVRLPLDLHLDEAQRSWGENEAST